MHRHYRMALVPLAQGIQGNERADHLAQVGRPSSPLYDKCQPGTMVRPINIDLLHPSPARAGQITGFGTPLGAQGLCEDVLTPDPTRAHHSIGVRDQGMAGASPLHALNLISPMTPMPGMLLDFDYDIESPARILQF